MTDEQLTNLLQQVAQEYRAENLDLPELRVTAIRRDGDWLYIAVWPDPQPARLYPYYDHLAKLETKLVEEHHVDVLLVPARAA